MKINKKLILVMVFLSVASYVQTSSFFGRFAQRLTINSTKLFGSKYGFTRGQCFVAVGLVEVSSLYYLKQIFDKWENVSILEHSALLLKIEEEAKAHAEARLESIRSQIDSVLGLKDELEKTTGFGSDKIVRDLGIAAGSNVGLHQKVQEYGGVDGIIEKVNRTVDSHPGLRHKLDEQFKQLGGLSGVMEQARSQVDHKSH